MCCNIGIKNQAGGLRKICGCDYDVIKSSILRAKEQNRNDILEFFGKNKEFQSLKNEEWFSTLAGGCNCGEADYKMYGGKRDFEPEAKEIHARVLVKIMEMMKLSEEDAKYLKAGLWYKIRQLHPEMSNLEQSREMEKNVTEEMLKTIDVEATKQAIKKHLEEKEKRKEMKGKKKPSKKPSKKGKKEETSESSPESPKEESSSEEKPKKKAKKEKKPKEEKPKKAKKSKKAEKETPEVSSEKSSESS